MLLYLCLLLALLLQTIFTLCFASICYKRQTDRIKKTILMFGALTFFGTIAVYTLIWIHHLWLIPYNQLVREPSDIAGWVYINILWLAFSHFLLWTWSLAMFTGAITLSSAHISAGKIKISYDSVLDRIMKCFNIEITYKSNICNLSWKLGGAIAVIPILFIIGIYYSLALLAMGLMIFILAGKNPLIPIGTALTRKNYDMETYRIKKIPVIPIIPIAIFFLVWLGLKLPVANFLNLMIILGIAAGFITLVIIAIKALIPKISKAIKLAKERKIQIQTDRLIQCPAKPRVKKEQKLRPARMPRPNPLITIWSVLKGKACLQVEYDE